MYHVMMKLIICILFVLLTLFFPYVTADNQVEVTTTRLYQEVYIDLLALPCVRLLNSTGTVGCSAKATTGILHAINNDSDLKSFIDDSTFSGSFILVLPLDLLTRQNIKQARASGKVVGLIVIEGSPRAAQISSHDLPCPDCGQTSFVQQDWNPQGTGLMFDDFSNFPMFAIFNSSADLSQSLNSLNMATLSNQLGNSPKFGAELSAFMNGAHNANDCLRRNMCKPIGGQSLYAPLFDSNNQGDQEIVMVTTSLDGKALFQDLAQATSTRMAGIAALLTAATALSTVDRTSFQRQILFTLFNGESWGHIGSRAFAKDIDTYKCEIPFMGPTVSCPYNQAACANPCIYDNTFQQLGLNTNRISNIIDANVLGGPSNELRVYTTTTTTNNNNNNNRDLPITFQNMTIISDKGIPPSPAIAFLERNPQTKPWVISTMNNQLPFNSSTEFDDNLSLNNTSLIDGICGAANIIARTAHILALGSSSNFTTGTNTTAVTANCTIAIQIMNCLTTATQCPFGSVISNVPRTSYSSVSMFGVRPTWPGLVAESILGLATARQQGGTCQRSDQCHDPNTPTCANGICVQSRVKYHLGFSSGLNMDPRTGIWSVVNTSIPHWVESNWDVTSVRLYYAPTMFMQVIEFITGIVVITITFLIIHFMRKTISV